MNREARLRAIELMASSGTRNPVDLARIAIVLRATSALDPDRDAILEIIKTSRKDWLNWLTVTQRRWQTRTRNPNKARHHDSISARERYVRCIA